MQTNRILAALLGISLVTVGLSAAPTSKVALVTPTPPMGWNSYDAFGDSVTEAEVLANAIYVKNKLLAHGWNYIVIDFRW